jgi:hypothetical protein
MLGAAVDLQRRRLLFGRADQHAIADSDHRPLAGVAVLGTFVKRRTRRRPDILPLMAKTTGALAHTKTAGFAEIVLPWIAGSSASEIVEGFVARPAFSERL